MIKFCFHKPEIFFEKDVIEIASYFVHMWRTGQCRRSIYNLKFAISLGSRPYSSHLYCIHIICVVLERV